MRDELRRRLMEWNGGELAETPPERAPVPEPPPHAARKPPQATAPAVAVLERGAPSLEAPLYDAPPYSTGYSHTDSLSLCDLLPGYECDRGPHGRHYCVETRLPCESDEWRGLTESFRGRWPRVAPSRSNDLARVISDGPERLLFFDIETAGLSDCPVFLIGFMVWDGTQFLIRQLLARSYAEEVAILSEASDSLNRFGILVSFNGKSFDLPFVRTRIERHRLPACDPPVHIDLLHHARRHWRKQVPNCRLQTLEDHLCGRKRVGDVPSSQIPGVYRRFLRDGDARPLQPVLHHNLLDLVTLAELLLLLFPTD